jgi:hypothetical protein
VVLVVDDERQVGLGHPNPAGLDVLWMIDRMDELESLDTRLLVAALEIWHADGSVFLSATDIAARLRRLRRS